MGSTGSGATGNYYVWASLMSVGADSAGTADLV